jgi:DNA-binding SARP family transcriptional activator
MDFRILGPIEAIEGNRPLALGGAKQRALLGMLLLHANEVVSSDRLIDELWAGDRREEAVRALQVAVSRLRKALRPDRVAGAESGLVVTRAPGYELRTDPERLDVKRFEALASEGKRALVAGDARSARAKLDEALRLWRGPPLADLAYESFCQAEIARLEELRLAALEDRIAADLELGRADVVAELEALTDKHPLRERLRGQLMLALYRSGRQAEALETYRQTRRVLVEELGIEPGRELRELHQAILRQEPGLDAATPVAPAAETPASAFVGREPELAELVGGLDEVFAGHGRLFLVVGEPGIGKSRLAEEVMRHARARGARVLVGRCWEAGGAPAYWPWVQSLRAFVRDADAVALRAQLGAGAAQLAHILPELRQRFPDLPEPPSSESDAARFRLFDATAEFLRNASESQPIVLVLDDLHAADAPSLLLLRFLARELGSTRILLLGAYRDVDPIPGRPLTDTLAEVAREPVTRRLVLGGLSEPEVVDYVELTASEIASPQLAATLHEETEGNPLFVGEIVRLLAVEGARSGSMGEPRLAIPQSVRDVIGRRLTHLSRACNRMLVLASVIGREFALDALARLGAVSEDVLLDVLDEAMAARVVSDVPGVTNRLRFAHVLIRDTLYDGLTSARRVRLHRLAVDALDALYGADPGPHLAELAHHAIAGHDFARGLRYAQRAGDRALALLAYEEAARLYTAALDASARTDPRDARIRCELLLSLGEAEIRAGNSLAAKRAFVDAAGIAQRLSLPRELARAAAGYGGRIVWARAGGDDRLVPLLEQGLAALGEGEVELRARLLARLAGALRDEHARARRDALSHEAVELARSTGNPAALAYALDGRAAAIMAPDTLAECLALGSELRDVAERNRDTERVQAGHFHRFVVLATVGDISGAEADLEAMIRIADELRQPVQLWQVCAHQATMALAAGRFSEAEELVSKAFALGERATPDMAIPAYHLQRYALCDFRGALDQVRSKIRDLVAEYPARTVFRCVLARLYTRLGLPDDARREFETLARDDFSGLPFDMEWLYGISLLAETCAVLSDAESAALLYGLLRPYAALNAADEPEGFRGSVSRYLGILATTTKRWDEAEQHFEHALAMNARMGARPWLAHTQHDYARMLLARARGRDRERARDLLHQAHVTYREVGMENHAASTSAPARTGASAS